MFRIKLLFLAWLVISFTGFSTSVLAGDLSEKDFVLHTGDFNSDGLTDLLHQARSSQNLHGTVLNDGYGEFTSRLQFWYNGHLGLNWTPSDHILHTGDFNQDGYSDVLLQATDSNPSFIVTANSYSSNSLGHLDTISASWPNNELGFSWSSQDSNIATGDFNGDGKIEVFLQGRNRTSSHAIIELDAINGPDSVIQSWGEDYLGHEWSGQTHLAHVGDFNGDGRSDIFLQAKYQFVLIAVDDIFVPVPNLPQTMHAILLSDADGRFTAITQEWGNEYLALDTAWMADKSNVVILDSNGDGRDEILLQSKSSTGTHYLLSPDSNGQINTITQSWQEGHLGQTWAGNSTTLITGDFDGDGRADIVLHSASGINNTISSDYNGQYTTSSTIHSDATESIVAKKNNFFSKPTAFGATEGAFDVDQGGSANYSVPIKVPPGIGGLQPSLALNYTSGGQNGLIGMGWSLSGLSAISRCPQNFAQDGKLDNIGFDTNDRLCLNGQRLIAVNGEYGAAGTEYRTESDSFSRITGMGGDYNTGYAWFKVETKSGQIFEYGNNNTSKTVLTKNNGSQVVLAWAVNKIEDAAGNYLTVNYQQSAVKGEHYPQNINYTLNNKPGSELSSALYRVDFEYEDRNDIQKGYFSTARMETSKRLTAIKVNADEQVVRQYFLQYEYDENTKFSRLINLVECGADASCKPAINFSWQNGQRWPADERNTSLCSDGSCGDIGGFDGTNDNRNSARYIDINGDGYMDVCYRHSSGIHCAYGSSNGIVESTVFNTGICANNSQAYGGCPSQSNYDTIKYVDVNADGMTDVTFRGEQGIQVVLSDGQSLTQHINTGIHPRETCDIDTGCATTTNNYNDIYFPDLNGDAYPDLCIRNSQGIKCRLNTHSAGFYNPTPDSGYDTDYCDNNADPGGCNSSDNYDTITFVDINVDGMQDLVYRQDDGVKFHYSTGNNFISGTQTTICRNGSPNCDNSDNHNTLQYPDINGDSIPDVCWRGDKGIACVPGTGDGFDTANTIETSICANTSWGGLEYSCNDYDNHYTIQYVDLNADGKSDLAYRSDEGIRSFLSTGSGFVMEHQTSICRNVNDQYYCDSNVNNHFTITYPDVNGDGLPDLAFRSDSGIRVHISDGKQPNLLTQVKDGLGNTTTINYKPLTDNSVHNGCTGAAYPELCVNMPSPVVSSYQASNGVGGSAIYSYQYSGYRLHLRGRGSLGFDQINRTDNQTGIVTTTTLDRRTSETVVDDYPDFYPYLGMPVRKTTSLNGVVLTDVNNTLAYNSTYPGRKLPYFPYFSTSTEIKRDYDTDTDVTETVTQNFFDEGQNHYAGNLTRVITTTTDKTTSTDSYADKVFAKTTENIYSDVIDTNNWQLGRLTHTTVTHTSNSDTVVRTSSFSYNNDGLISETREEPGDPELEVITGYSYDVYGNKSQVNRSGNSAATFPVEARTTTSGYVAGTVNLLTRQTISSNALGHSETKRIDSRFGVTSSLTGPNGLTTQWKYDGFGRKIKEIRADGTESKITREFCDGNCLPVGSITPTYRITTRTDGQATKIAYYDSLDRQIRTESVSVDGQTVYQDTVYDSLGRISKASEPYFRGDTKYWTHYDYDELNRPVSETRGGTGMVRNSIYGPLSTTVIVNNASGLDGSVRTHVKTNYNYANGKLRKVEENKSDTEVVIINYQYDATGNLLQVDAPNSPPVLMNYDKKGRKIAMTDPDMGSWSYAYDAYGNLRRQLDSLNQQVDIIYDRLDRKVLRIEKEGASVWQYDSAVDKGLGKLDTVIGPIPLTSSQLAAQRANPSVSDALAVSTAADFSRTYTYDSLGRPSTTMTVIDSIPYEFSTSYDRYGRVAIQTYPENVGSNQRLNVRNVYDTNGFLLRVENAVNDNVFWRLGDNNGNLSDSTNARGQVTMQTFGNSLTTIKVHNPADGMVQSITTGNTAQVQNLDYVFDSLGNLEQRRDHNQQFNNQPVTEQFSYDHLDRLKSTSLNGLQGRQFAYDDNGNIIYNSGFGTYRYDGASGSHAVDDILDANNQVINHYSYDDNGNMIGDSNRAIAYTSFNKPRLITAGGESISFKYSADRTRYKQIKSDSQIIYLGKRFERETNGTTTRDVHYISAGGRLVGTYTVTETNSIQTRYFHTDHLGSIDVITDEQGGVIERMSFSAFGQRRNLDWSYSSVQLFASQTRRGYTGHEQLDSVGFIHMNGRVYDPQLGRFISADPHIQAPDSSQNYNRYSYVNNNPLSYTDPTGYFFSGLFHSVHKFMKRNRPYIKAAIKMYLAYKLGGAVGQATNSTLFGSFVGGATHSAMNGGNPLVGGLHAMVLTYIGGKYSAEDFDDIQTIFAHGVVGGIRSELEGRKFSDGFWSAAVGKAVTISFHGGSLEDNRFLQGSATIIAGGLSSKLGGGDFDNGAITAAFGYVFNELFDAGHKWQKDKYGNEYRRAPMEVNGEYFNVKLWRCGRPGCPENYDMSDQATAEYFSALNVEMYSDAIYASAIIVLRNPLAAEAVVASYVSTTASIGMYSETKNSIDLLGIALPTGIGKVVSRMPEYGKAGSRQIESGMNFIMNSIEKDD